MNHRFHLLRSARIGNIAQFGSRAASGFASFAMGLTLSAAALLFPGPSAGAWPNLPIAPLTLQAIGDPNIIVTMDDSGSMSWDAVPDSKVGTNVFRRLAFRWNALAYNPFTVYELPYSTALDGTRLATSFTAAPINGFNAAGGTANLSNNYQTHWAYSSGNLGCYGTCTTYGNGQAAMDDRAKFPVGAAFFLCFL